MSDVDEDDITLSPQTCQSPMRPDTKCQSPGQQSNMGASTVGGRAQISSYIILSNKIRRAKRRTVRMTITIIVTFIVCW